MSHLENLLDTSGYPSFRDDPSLDLLRRCERFLCYLETHGVTDQQYDHMTEDGLMYELVNSLLDGSLTDGQIKHCAQTLKRIRDELDGYRWWA